ncbi:MAG: GerMN domain-containing protein [Cyanobacteria bacterium SZAS TMP-1]|nr:GerMN domain-containing protein [Cyanobacteria bacterium SZAS TMP-1]
MIIRASIPKFLVVLLAVPALLSACRDRTVLSGDDEKAPALSIKKKVVVGRIREEQPVKVQIASNLEPKNTGHPVIWFARTGGDRIKYQPVTCPPADDAADQSKIGQLKHALIELLKGPGTSAPEGLSSEIPAGTVLIDASEDPASGAITINLSRRFVAGAGPDSFEARLEQVRRTVWGVVGTQPVYLNVEGQRLEASGDGLEVKQPINASAGSDTGSDEHAAPPN